MHRLHWEGEFSPLCSFRTPADGSCLFHALLAAFFDPYHRAPSEVRAWMIRTLRSELANSLVDAPYLALAGGNLAPFAEGVPEFSLESMKAALDSREWIGTGHLEHIANCLGKDIYIVDRNRRDVYRSGEENLLQRGRPGVVLLFDGGHFETGGYLERDGSVTTLFSPSHPFLIFLRERQR